VSRNRNPLIIERADLLSRRHRLTAAGITLFFWAALLYLWQPVISLIAWSINIRLFYNHMVVLGGYQAFLDLLAFYAIVILVLGGGLILWAKSNEWRFRGRNRRGARGDSDDARDIERYAIDRATLAEWRGRKRMKIAVGQDGRLEAATETESADDAPGAG
jgi:biofilm PGA synthesis protein PgaD